MLRRYINLFLTLLMPLSILSIIVATLIFTFKFDLSESLKLGILVGIAAGVGLSLIFALILMIKRRVESIVTHSHMENDSIEESRTQIERSLSKQNNTFILFMDNSLAFETSIYVITKNLLGEIIGTDEKLGIINIKDEYNDKLRLNIKMLTTHTSIIEIDADDQIEIIEDIFYALKEMDRSFMRY